jgi:hypothetical protein
MKKTISYRLFSIGGISKKLRPVLEKEGMLVCDEGIRGWFVTKNFKAPGKRFWYRQEGFSGFGNNRETNHRLLILEAHYQSSI